MQYTAMLNMKNGKPYFCKKKKNNNTDLFFCLPVHFLLIKVIYFLKWDSPGDDNRELNPQIWQECWFIFSHQKMKSQMEILALDVSRILAISK